MAPRAVANHIPMVHPGSGTLLEALRAPYTSEQAYQRQIVAVSNRALMDDHQAELARALANPKPYVHLADPRYVLFYLFTP